MIICVFICYVCVYVCICAYGRTHGGLDGLDNSERGVSQG